MNREEVIEEWIKLNYK